ncbi:MAG: hypothetical protein ACOYD4_05345 [Solirubrobacterales bacterium]
MQRLNPVPNPLLFRLAWLIALVLSAVGLGSVPSAAGADEIRAANVSGRVYLGHSEGPRGRFEVQLSSLGDRVVVLYVHGGPLRELPSGEWARYAVRPQQSLADGILRAEFGSIGSVSLRFERNGETKLGRVPDHCSGARPRRESGVYRGSISLRGEDGYFRLDRVAAEGGRVRAFRLVCDPGQAGGPFDPLG